MIFDMGRTSDARERLLAAALELIWGHGYCSVGVDAICERAGVRKGSFYHFFTSKSELAAEAIQSYWEAYRPQLDTVFSPSVPPLERLEAYFRSVHEFQRERKIETGHVCGCPFFDLGTETSNLEPAIVERVRGILERYFRYFASAICEAHAKGLIRVADPEQAARWLMNYFEGALMNARIHNDPDYLLDLSEGAMQILGVHSRGT